MNVELTKKEIRMLQELLSLDLDAIGFEEEEIELLDDINEKLGKSLLKRDKNISAGANQAL